MTVKVHSPERLRELAAQGFALVARMSAERRERDKKQRQARAAPASPTNSAYPVDGSVSDPASLAEQIVAAGQRARGELADETPRATGLAARIHDAAETARGGGPERAQPTGLAKQIIDAGRRRRGEI
jgi:hypothetical protein